MSSKNTKLEEVKKTLDSIGPGMCLAKWTQTTIHLGLGQTHSCHHPKTHTIPISEIKKNSAALHNTDYKKSIRKEMLEGKRPKECSFCWGVEDLKKQDVYSDRILKSADSWSWPYFYDVLMTGHNTDIDPKYLEISFSNVCNFKCSYCMPSVSSQWWEEIEKFGPYPTSRSYNDIKWEKEDGRIPILNKEDNPYVDAFWDWFPKIYKGLHTFRLTGGEPLLDKNTFKVLDFIIENPNPNMEFSINSNFCVPDKLFNTFIDKIKHITSNGLVRNFLVYTSAEAKGERSEYIRHGMSYNKWLDNIYRYIDELPGKNISVMSTYNALSATSYLDFMKDMYRVNCYATYYDSLVGLDIPHLLNPAHQSIKILTPDFLEYFNEQISWAESIGKKYSDVRPGFLPYELEKLKRVKTVFEQELAQPTIDTDVRRRDFAIFVDEHDKRRGTNFLKTFPEMTDFYNFCKS